MLIGLAVLAFFCRTPVPQTSFRDEENLWQAKSTPLAQATRSDTPELLRAWKYFQSYQNLDALATKGEPKLATPVYIQVLATVALTTAANSPLNSSLSEIALKGLVASNTPEAIRALKKIADNPQAPKQFHLTALSALAAWGQRDARKRLASWRSFDRTVPPFAQRMNLENVSKVPEPLPKGILRYEGLVDVRGDYGLMTSRVFGGRSDLFVVRWKGDRWVDPVFTGDNLAFVLPEVKGENVRSDEDVKAFIADWDTRFARNPELRRDSDGDGLTDLAEAKLGTDPRKRDTDGDGLSDGVDRNPLAAPRRLDVDEQMLFDAFKFL